ncbi:hypothetical protein Syun_013881 [Stephania yunnanensis]|uniref:VQ domain-containing protein n=1 Tax=Stephania yunnanensis TaxID=152371 RepID=A0AAP0JJB9_9MAGN
MEESSYPAEDSPTGRRELQGPRPPRLKVHKDSHMIKKPPLPHHHQLQQQQQQLLLQREQIQRQPIVIYTVSPKIIHVKPSDFSAMVQRLTGSSSSSNYSASEDQTTTTTSGGGVGGAVVLSPAARLATIERASPREHNTVRSIHSTSNIDETILDEFGDLDCLRDSDEVMRSGFHGILSPQPSGLPPISPNFFSGLPDPTSLTYFHDINQIFHADTNTSSSSFIVSSASPQQRAALINSPSMGQFFDLLNQFLNSPSFQQ